MVKRASTLYTVNTYSKASHFQDTGLSKIGIIGNAPIDLKLTLSSYQLKSNHRETQIWVRFTLRAAFFWDTRLMKIRNIGNVPNDHILNLKTWQTKVTHIHQISTSKIPNLGPFCSTTSHLRDKKLLKFGKLGDVPNDLRLPLDTRQSKSTPYTLSTREAQISVRFTLQLAFLRYKVAENRKNQKRTERSQSYFELLAAKSILYVLSLLCPT